MKFVLYILFFLCFIPLLHGQDTVIRSRTGRIEISKKVIGNEYNVTGTYNHQNKNKWIEGKVKKIEYEYMYVRTYNGSTQPSNPKEFYKPIKKKTYYYLPASDITIWYNDSGKIQQIFRIDSTILRSYYENGKPKSIHYYSETLELDSVYHFYSNGKIKTKLIGNWDPRKDNFSVSLSNQALIYQRFEIEKKTEIEHHGNGKPYIRIEFEPTKEKRETLGKEKVKNYPFLIPDYSKEYYYRRSGYTNTYTLYDTAGIPTNDTYYTSDHKWTGIKYEYYESGILQSKKNVLRDKPNGVYEFWNKIGEITHRQYYRSWHCDSTVYYKQIGDTLFAWKEPFSFYWNTNTHKAEYVKNDKGVIFRFNENGELIEYSFDGNRFYIYSNQHKDSPVTKHIGDKDKYGLPHGRWIGINESNDTIYDINFYHGRLHGKYFFDFKKNHQNWTRNYNMGLECDSSYQFYNGIKNKIFYYSSPGRLCKKVENYTNGKLCRKDTTLNGVTFTRLLVVHSDGWIVEKSTFDSLNRRIHTQHFSKENIMDREIWTDYGGLEMERKNYFPNTGKLNMHLIYTGNTSIPNNLLIEKYDEKGEIVESVPGYRTVRNAIRKTYDENGILIEEVKLQDGNIVN